MTVRREGQEAALQQPKNQDGLASVAGTSALRRQGRDYITGARFTVVVAREAQLDRQTRMLGTLTAKAHGEAIFGQGDSAKTVEALRFTSPTECVPIRRVDCQALVISMAGMLPSVPRSSACIWCRPDSR